ncbi:MAG: GNAT family N-acetyltransferase [Sandaracinaceae bacterium]|jgi:aminoglycoside 3-N-acetyltransferase I|nr:GNAT family N-acetyltransferase [Sandaracinaceae bacterium]MBK6809336.1 GNAT family N-acetyltransferase [Sandaracinaceae bacterium]MBK7778060.1 GNAT family N-acetyltransferase [Sandaracinaceae bacterium]MBK8588566.1 GNAT family N-acetyltransferase [Sandaracinaceae bacterium]MBP7684537.1 GNAT family N-acetyltransferase [Deltaproteobacteria bacterium]
MFTVERLGPSHLKQAHELFTMMAQVFEEERAVLPDEYVQRLLQRADLFILAAVEDGSMVGGLTAHVLPMTRTATSELFIYDLAVRVDHQRRGIGRALVEELHARGLAEGIDTSFVPADEEDTHALDFYRALGAEESPVRFFVFEP